MPTYHWLLISCIKSTVRKADRSEIVRRCWYVCVAVTFSMQFKVIRWWWSLFIWPTLLIFDSRTALFNWLAAFSATITDPVDPDYATPNWGDGVSTRCSRTMQLVLLYTAAGMIQRSFAIYFLFFLFTFKCFLFPIYLLLLNSFMQLSKHSLSIHQHWHIDKTIHAVSLKAIWCDVKY